MVGLELLLTVLKERQIVKSRRGLKSHVRACVCVCDSVFSLTVGL